MIISAPFIALGVRFGHLGWKLEKKTMDIALPNIISWANLTE